MTDAALAERARPRDCFVTAVACPAACPQPTARPAVESYDLADASGTDVQRCRALDRLAPSTQRAYRQAWRGWRGVVRNGRARSTCQRPRWTWPGTSSSWREAGKSMATIRLAVAGIDAHHRVAELYGGDAHLPTSWPDAWTPPGGSRLVRDNACRRSGSGPLARRPPTASRRQGAGRGQAAPLNGQDHQLDRADGRSCPGHVARGDTRRGRKLPLSRAAQDVAIAWLLYDGLLRRGASWPR